MTAGHMLLDVRSPSRNLSKKLYTEMKMGCVTTTEIDLPLIAPKLLPNVDTARQWANDRRSEWRRDDLMWWQQPPKPDQPGEWIHLVGERRNLRDMVFNVFRCDHMQENEPRVGFSYWNGNHIQLSEYDDDENWEAVIDFFMRRLDLTPQWTPICTYAHLYVKDPLLTLCWLRYEPTEPGVSPRNLMGALALEYLDEKDYPLFILDELNRIEKLIGKRLPYKVALLMARSLPSSVVNRDKLGKEEFIEWRASCLFVDRCEGHGVAVYKFDAENQRGRLGKGIGKALTDYETPRYDQDEAYLTTRYTLDNRLVLLNSYRLEKAVV